MNSTYSVRRRSTNTQSFDSRERVEEYERAIRQKHAARVSAESNSTAVDMTTTDEVINKVERERQEIDRAMAEFNKETLGDLQDERVIACSDTVIELTEAKVADAPKSAWLFDDSSFFESEEERPEMIEIDRGIDLGIMNPDEEFLSLYEE